MKLNLTLMCAIVAISLLLIACSPASKQASVEVSCDDFYKQHHITKEVQISAGDSFTVNLCSNPSTGFRWFETASISDQTVVQQTDHKLVMLKSEPPPPPGTPGQEVWTFKALKKGTSTVSMEYSRPWEGGEKEEWTFELTVIVKQIVLSGGLLC